MKTFLFGIKTETERARSYRALDGLRGNTFFQEQHNALSDTNCTKNIFALASTFLCIDRSVVDERSDGKESDLRSCETFFPRVFSVYFSCVGFWPIWLSLILV